MSESTKRSARIGASRRVHGSPTRPRGPVAATLLSLLALLAPAETRGQVSFDFEGDDPLASFVNAAALTLSCDGVSLPLAPLSVDNGELVLTNDSTLGLSMTSLQPDVVAADFADLAGGYKVRLTLTFETALQFVTYLNARMGKREEDKIGGEDTFANYGELGYYFVFAPAGLLGPDGIIALVEESICHDDIEHASGEWPGSELFDADFALVTTGSSILPETEYFVEMTTRGSDLGGPVYLTARIWDAAEDEPAIPQLIAFDPDGLCHTDDTLDPVNNIQVLLGTDFDGGVIPRTPGGTTRVDDLSVSALSGCPEPPASVTRTFPEWGGAGFAEQEDVRLFDFGSSYRVVIEISDVRQAGGGCDAGAALTISERVPLTWTVSDVSAGGEHDPVTNTIVWEGLDLTTDTSVSYRIDPPGDGDPAFTRTMYTFDGHVLEPGSDYVSRVGGPQAVAHAQTVGVPVSDFGVILDWLMLGPFRTPQDPPFVATDERARLDYLTDGTLTEVDVLPRAGDTITPDYGGDAASTGKVICDLARNPGGVTRWIEWRDRDDADDRIDIESVYGELQDAMVYAVTYLNVEEETVVNFGISIDDTAQILLDGEEIYFNDHGSALALAYQDTLLQVPGLGDIVLEEGQHVLMVKLFEFGGDHNFRVGFTDENGIELPGGPEEVTISLEPDLPPPAGVGPFVRGDCNDDGRVDIADAVCALNWLFAGGATPTCIAAINTNGDDAANIADPTYLLGHLFSGEAPPVEPYPDCGRGLLAADEELGCADPPDCQ